MSASGIASAASAGIGSPMGSGIDSATGVGSSTGTGAAIGFGRRRRISIQMSSPPRAATTENLSSPMFGSRCSTAPNSSSCVCASAGSNSVNIPVIASRVSPWVEMLIVCVPTTTYGRSPTCMTSASPSARTIAESRESARATTVFGCLGCLRCRRCLGREPIVSVITHFYARLHTHTSPSAPFIGRYEGDRYRARSARCRDIKPNSSGMTETRSKPRAVSRSATPRAPG